MFECLGQSGSVVGIDEDHDIVVSYSSGNRLVRGWIEKDHDLLVSYSSGNKLVRGWLE